MNSIRRIALAQQLFDVRARTQLGEVQRVRGEIAQAQRTVERRESRFAAIKGELAKGSAEGLSGAESARILRELRSNGVLLQEARANLRAMQSKLEPLSAQYRVSEARRARCEALGMELKREAREAREALEQQDVQEVVIAQQQALSVPLLSPSMTAALERLETTPSDVQEARTDEDRSVLAVDGSEAVARECEASSEAPTAVHDLIDSAVIDSAVDVSATGQKVSGTANEARIEGGGRSSISSSETATPEQSALANGTSTATVSELSVWQDQQGSSVSLSYRSELGRTVEVAVTAVEGEQVSVTLLPRHRGDREQLRRDQRLLIQELEAAGQRVKRIRVAPPREEQHHV